MKKWMILLTISILISLPALTRGREKNEEDQAAPATMEEVVVTATRSEERTEKVPANVTVIDQNDIKNSNAKTVVDLLRSQEGLVVRDLLGNGKTAQVDLRGYGEAGPYNTLVLVDGRRVNEIDLSGVDWTQIPLEQIERIEIVRGTGTVLYGDNAVGGVINIITKIPSEKLIFTAGTRLGSYGHNKELVSLSGGSESVGASLFASYDATNGYRDNGELRAGDVGGKVVFDPTEFLSLSLSGSYHSDDYGLPGTLTQQELEADRRASTSPTDEGSSRDKYLKLGVEADLGKYGSLVTDISIRDRDGEARFPDPSFPFVTESESDTWSITPRYVCNGEFIGHANTLSAGLDAYWAKQEVRAFSGFFSPVTALSSLAEIEKDSYGIYAHDEFSLRQNLILSLGARQERVKYHLKKRDLSAFFPLSSLDDNVAQRENAYTAGLTYLYRDRSSLFLRVNRSLRFPLTDEMVISDYVAGRIRVNAGLKAQKGRHYEVGIRHDFTPTIRANAALFRAEIKDEIFLNRFPSFSNENHPETLHQGVEIGASADLVSTVAVFGNYTYEKATFEKDPFKDQVIPAVPRHKANAGFRIHDVIPGIIFSMDYNYVGSSFAISDQANRFEKLPSYYTINARLSYEWKRLSAFIGVNNLTDREYSESAVLRGVASPEGVNYYPAPERNWVGGLEITF